MLSSKCPWLSDNYTTIHFQIPFSHVPIKVDVPEIISVSSGLRHSTMVTKEGKVLVCGNGKRGQLGLVDNNGEPISQLEQPQEGMYFSLYVTIIEYFPYKANIQRMLKLSHYEYNHNKWKKKGKNEETSRGKAHTNTRKLI